MLDETGLFRVDVVTAPAQSGELAAFMPSFAEHQAVVFNYDAPDERWPAATKRAFDEVFLRSEGIHVVPTPVRAPHPKRTPTPSGSSAPSAPNVSTGSSSSAAVTLNQSCGPTSSTTTRSARIVDSRSGHPKRSN